MKIIQLNKNVIGIVFNRYISDADTLSKLREKGYSVTEVTEYTDTIKNNNDGQRRLGDEQVTQSEPIHTVGNLGNSVTEDSPKDLILAFIKARQTEGERNALQVLEAAKQLGLDQSFVDGLLRTGDIYEPVSGHYKVLE